MKVSSCELAERGHVKILYYHSQVKMHKEEIEILTFFYMSTLISEKVKVFIWTAISSQWSSTSQSFGICFWEQTVWGLPYVTPSYPSVFHLLELAKRDRCTGVRLLARQYGFCCQHGAQITWLTLLFISPDHCPYQERRACAMTSLLIVLGFFECREKFGSSRFDRVSDEEGLSDSFVYCQLEHRDSIFQLMMDSKNWHAGMFKGIKSGSEIKRNGQQIANKELKEGLAFSPVLCPPLRVVQEKIRGHMTTWWGLIHSVGDEQGIKWRN